MDRRCFLQAMSGAGTIALTGCTSIFRPDYEAKYREMLVDKGVDIAELNVSERVVSLEYYGTAREKHEIPHLATVCGAFGGFVQRGWDVTRLNVRVITREGDLTATYFMTKEMVEKLMSEELTDVERGRLLLSTVEMKNGSSDSQ